MPESDAYTPEFKCRLDNPTGFGDMEAIGKLASGEATCPYIDEFGQPILAEVVAVSSLDSIDEAVKK